MSDLQLKLEPPIARLSLNRPERRNAMSEAMWNALTERCNEIEASAEIKAVLVEGIGGHFCSGADISEFDDVFAETQRAQRYLGAIERSLNALAGLDRPTLAKVEGSCMGGGLAIALACDLRFAVESAQMSAPPAKLGLLYGVAETRLLIDAVGSARAKDLLFSARRIEAPEALTLGLVHRVASDSELSLAVESELRRWTELSAVSIRGAKKAIRAALAGRESDVRAMVLNVAMGEDFREGRAAFRDKRSPNFSG